MFKKFMKFQKYIKSHFPLRIKKAICFDILIIFLISISFAVYLHWNAFVQPDRFHDNWRQAPHWSNPENQKYQEDDIIIKYAEFNFAPLSNFVYMNLARTGIDILWGKINAVLFFSIAAMCIYLVGRSIGNRFSGWISAIIFPGFSTTANRSPTGRYWPTA